MKTYVWLWKSRRKWSCGLVQFLKLGKKKKNKFKSSIRPTISYFHQTQLFDSCLGTLTQLSIDRKDLMSLTYESTSFQPQALSTGLHSRVTKDPENALIINTAPQGRSAKRNAQQINYAEFDNVDDFEFEDTPSSTLNASLASANAQFNANTQKLLLKPAKIIHSVVGGEDESQKLQELVHKPQEDILIPIRLDLEYNAGNSKLVDFFMWNLNEALITPEQFATSLCNDLDLPGTINQEIVESINKQIEDYNFVSTLQPPNNVEIHVVIDLAVSLDKKLYQDKFEWDLYQTDVTPETFADIVVADLGLSLEFKPAISHSLHEVVLRLKKEISEGTYNHELQKYQQLAGLIFESGIRIRTESSVHNGNNHWEPIIEVLTPWEIEKREIERERNIRRLKRENMRREVDEFSSNKRRAIMSRRRYDELEGTWKN